MDTPKTYFNLVRLIEHAKQSGIIFADSALADLSSLLETALAFKENYSYYSSSYDVIVISTGKKLAGGSEYE